MSAKINMRGFSPYMSGVKKINLKDLNRHHRLYSDQLQIGFDVYYISYSWVKYLPQRFLV